MESSLDSSLRETGRKRIVIGPFLGPLANGVRIVVALPDDTAESVLCYLESTNPMVLPPIRSESEYGTFRVFTFDFIHLKEGERYAYNFKSSNGTAVELEGLTASDCFFVYHATLDEGSIVCLSCHNPFEHQRGSAEYGWTMWQRLEGLLNTSSAPRLLVMAGDQVYNDALEKPMLLRMKLGTSSPEELRRFFIENYALFWGHSSYRKVLARIPSIAMWDDHDITDGWGGRMESFNGKLFTKEWTLYFNLAKEAFIAYQAIRNPDPLLVNGAKSFIMTKGASAVCMVDLRHDKNAQLEVLLAPDHEAALFNALQSLPRSVESVFLVLPVVPFRTNTDEDRRLSSFSRTLFNITHHIESSSMLRICFLVLQILLWGICLYSVGHASLDMMFIPLAIMSFAVALALAVPEIILSVPELPKLSDDLEDGLTSDCNRATLERILLVLFGLNSGGKQVVIVSGDIHLAGMSEIILKHENGYSSIPQVVTSPISNKPMDKSVAGFTTTTSEMTVRCPDNSLLWARNIFYMSKRNFVEIFPAALAHGKPFVFHLEDHQLPIAFPATFHQDLGTTSKGSSHETVYV